MGFGSWLKKAAWWGLGGPMIGSAKWLWDRMNQRVSSPAARVPQFSSYGQPLPIVYGKTRITGNVIYCKKQFYGDLNATMIALCEGPIAGITRVWRDQKVSEVAWVDGSAPDWYGLFGAGPGWSNRVRVGSRPTQVQWDTLVTYDSTAADATYPGVAYVAYANKTSPEMLVGYSFEVKGFLTGTGGGLGDAHPADIVYDFLTDTRYGCAIDTSRVDVEVGQGTIDSSLRRYCTAEGFWISPAITDRREAREHLREILDSVNADVVWSQGQFRFYPYGDVAVTGNAVTYTPVTTLRYALTTADFLDEEDPIHVELEPDTDRWNIWPVEFLERAPASAATDKAHAYNVAIVESEEPTDEQASGPKRAPTARLHAICIRAVAQKIAQIRAQRSVFSRASYTFRLPWQFCRLEPMDLVSLTDETLGLDGRVVRITAVEEDADFNLTVRAEEWPIGVAGAVEHATQSSEGAVVFTDEALLATETAARDGSNVADGADPFYTAINLLDGTRDAGIGFYSGMESRTTRGGAPDIWRLNIAPKVGSAANGIVSHRWAFRITPSDGALPGTDNIDTLRTLRVRVFDTSSATSPLDTFDIPIQGRAYKAGGTAAENGVYGTIEWTYRSTPTLTYSTAPNMPLVYLRCSLQNVYGWSAELDFAHANSTADLARQQFYVTGTSGTSSSSGGGGLSTCPAPWVLLDLADGTQREAEHVQVGDLVRTRPEAGGEYGVFPVEAVSHETNEIGSVTVAPRDRPLDLLSLHFASNHRFSVEGRGWVELRDLAPGDVIEGSRPGTVVRTEILGFAPVVRITVAEAHTYETSGLWSHNAKTLG